MRRNAIAYVALFAAIGGGAAYAGAKIGSNDIAANAIKAKQLAPSALTTKHGVIQTHRIDIDDPNPSPPMAVSTSKELLSFGPFTLTGICQDLGSVRSNVTVESSETAYGVGTTETTDPDAIGSTPMQLAPQDGSLNSGAANPRAITAGTPSGKFISVSIFEVNRVEGPSGPDCSFWVSGTGRR